MADAQGIAGPTQDPTPGKWRHLLGQPVTPKFKTHKRYGQEGWVTKAAGRGDKCLLNIRMGTDGVKLIEQDSEQWMTGPSAGKEVLDPAHYDESTAPTYSFTYTNHRGQTSRRHVQVPRWWWGSTDWHPTPGWLLKAYDLEKQAERDYALDGMAPDALTALPPVPPEPSQQDRLSWARCVAVQAWRKPGTSGKAVDVGVAEEFAQLLLKEQEHNQSRMQVAVQSNQQVDALLRDLNPDLPQHYGMPVDGIRQTIEAVTGMDLHALRNVLRQQREQREASEAATPQQRIHGKLDQVLKHAMQVANCHGAVGSMASDGRRALEAMMDDLQTLRGLLTNQWEGYQKQLIVVREHVEALFTVEQQVQFIDDACARIMPWCLQLCTYNKPVLAGAEPKLTIDFGRAAFIALQSATALWSARLALNTGERVEPATPQSPQPDDKATIKQGPKPN